MQDKIAFEAAIASLDQILIDLEDARARVAEAQEELARLEELLPLVAREVITLTPTAEGGDAR